ncbi:hypothetical protein [uncultured Sphingobacterium sp.]|uniref:hypothetical protein n=1 Tax=uncultured Sphingobacterium sp. TaxID=182688 RepID=UPI0025FD2436|nr:hypothetical protein [uncultured Sphingobacterium sp.]
MKSIKALEVTSVKDNKTGQFLTTIPDRFKSNCSGYAFTDGQYWIVDSYESTTRNEIADFENLLNSNSLYQKQIGSTNANVAVIWWTDKSTGERFIAHSAIVDSTNKYMQKSDYSMHGIATFEGFTDGHLPSDSNLYSYEIAYYKRNF